MGMLARKLGRDLLGHAGTLLAAVAIIAVGTGAYIGMASAQRTLEASQKAYYADCRFADFWVDLKKAPLSAVEALARLDGVGEVQGRVVFDVILDLPHEVQPVSGRLISLPVEDAGRTLNAIRLLSGPGFSATRDEEVILAAPFAEARGLAPGDRVAIILNRKRESFVVVGTALSPEYVYMVRGEGDFVPDPARFGVLFVKQRYAQEALGFRDSCNQVIGRLAAGAEVDVDRLLDRIARRLDAYGVVAATPRERQASHRFLSDEIEGLGVSATVLPGIFLVVAALVLNVAMNRLAQQQRTVLGALKAIGHSNAALTAHLLSFGLAVGLAGGAAGIGIGLWLASGMLDLYKDFFQFPAYVGRLNVDLFIVGLGVSVVFAVGGTVRGALAVLRLSPAQAMRPRPPAAGGRVLLERWAWLWRRLGFRTHLAVRNLFRNRGRTLTGIVAAALATTIILATLMMYDSAERMVDSQFERVLHSDADIGMRDEASLAALREAAALPGVDRAEPVLGLVCTLQNGPARRRVSVTGLSKRHRLTTPIGADGQAIDIPPAGLVMSRKLAEVLNVGLGGHVLLTPVRGRRATQRVPVASVVESYFGLACYADIDYLSGLVGESLAMNAIQTTVDPSDTERFYRALKRLPNAQGLSVRRQAKANIEQTFVKSMAATLGITVLFAGVIAFGATINASLIELADRRREVATLHVMGYRPRQIAGIFFRESVLVAGIGMLIAVPLSWVLVHVLAAAYDTEVYRMPVIIRPGTVLAALAASAAFVLVAQLVVLRQVRRTNWADAIKVQE